MKWEQFHLGYEKQHTIYFAPHHPDYETEGLASLIVNP